MKLTLVDESGYRIDEQWLQGQLDRVVASLQSRGYWPRSEKSKNICMVFLNRLEAKGINWKFRQKDYATDILSFESEDSETLGELLICPEVVEENAKKNRHSFEDEMTYMTLHGVLHLLGFDHEQEGVEAEKMLQLQDEIFAELKSAEKKSRAERLKKSAKKKVSSAKNTASRKPKKKTESKKRKNVL